MYDFKLKRNEVIKLISDNSIVIFENDSILVTSIITNQRLLILDYPSGSHNSMEDLRISGRMNYIRKKEIICEIDLKNILSITKDDNYYKINIKDSGYLNLSDDSIIEYLKKVCLF